MFFCILLKVDIFIATDMHLRTDTVDFGYTVSLPFLDPVDKTLHLLIIVPIGLQIVVVDEECQILRTILAGEATSLTDVVEIAQMILPIECIATNIPCATLIAR